MKKEDIIRIAYEIGIDYIGVAGIQRFAAEIRAATKEEDAGICEPYTKSPSDHEAGVAIAIQDKIRASK